jgi:hypothetical protein
MTQRAELERFLRIDEDDLDSCLVSQPGYFYQVAEALAASNARRDTVKLRVEEVTAELDQSIRAEAANSDTKITEAGIQNQLRTLPRIKDLRQEYVEACAESERWAALKEAYHQRSYMLKELVALQLSQFYNLSVERGAVSARGQLGEVARARGEEQRRERRQGR